MIVRPTSPYHTRVDYSGFPLAEGIISPRYSFSKFHSLEGQGWVLSKPVYMPNLRSASQQVPPSSCSSRPPYSSFRLHYSRPSNSVGHREISRNSRSTANFFSVALRSTAQWREVRRASRVTLTS